MTGADVVMSPTNDGGEIEVENGLVTLGGSLDTSVYLSLFGGQAEDPGSRESSEEWWGNRGVSDVIRRYRSQTQHLLRSIPASSGNLLRIKDAVENDLRWMLSTGAATAVRAQVTIPALNRVRIEIEIDADSRENVIVYEENWRLDT